MFEGILLGLVGLVAGILLCGMLGCLVPLLGSAQRWARALMRLPLPTWVMLLNTNETVTIGPDVFVCGYALTNSSGRALSVAFAYDGINLTNRVYTLPNANVLALQLTREPARRELVTQRAYTINGQPVYSCSTDYDLLGRPTNAVDSISRAWNWLYNRRSELVGATIGTNRYGSAYDSIGNRQWASANAVTNAYVANNLNQYTSILRGSATLREPTYDADGNLTNDCTFVYAYDAENRLVSAYPLAPVAGSRTVENVYDHQHRRVRKIVRRFNDGSWSLAETHTFVWDGNNIVLERVVSADGVTQTIEYFWGPDKSGTEQGAGGVGGLLAVSKNGVFHIPCYDHNGNIVCYVSETGSVAAEYVYDPYGNVIEASGTLPSSFNFGFSTKHHDREIGMIAYQRRFYRPDLGRWLNRDPIEEEGGANLYAFCVNNPIVYYDPAGESFEDVSNFCAGVGDALTMGLTRLFRRGLNRMIEGDWDDPADIGSTAYFAGEVTEVTVEVVVTLGGASLRHTAKSVSRDSVERGTRRAYRRVHGLVGKGGEVHHINPIKGHPNGKPARFPLSYEWAARGDWNLKWYPTRAEHRAAHARMQMLETIDKYRESTLITRQSINGLINYLCFSPESECWKALDVRTTIRHGGYENNGVNLNAVPEHVTSQIR